MLKGKKHSIERRWIFSPAFAGVGSPTADKTVRSPSWKGEVLQTSYISET